MVKSTVSTYEWVILSTASIVKSTILYFAYAINVNCQIAMN